MKIATSLRVACFLMAGSLIACQPAPDQQQAPKQEQEMQKISYPITEKGTVVDTYFDQKIADPYRWLEDDRSPETEAWVVAQNQVTQSYLQQIPFRAEIADVVRNIINYERVSAPFTEGAYTYFYKNDGLQNQSVVYRQKEGSEPEVFIDPNKFSDDGTVSLAALAFSDDGSLAAYQTSTGGSDWRQVYTINTATMEQIGVPLQDVKFSGLSWYKNEGFYYSSYDKPTGSELSDKTDQHKLYYHKVGTEQSADLKVFGHTEEEKHRYVSAQVSEDNRFLLVMPSVTTSGNRAFLKDLSKPDSDWLVVKENASSDLYMLTSKDDMLYFVTNHEAPNTRIVSVNINAPDIANWQDVIAETENVLVPSTAGGFIFAEYMEDAISKVYQYTLAGEQVRSIELPGLGNAGGFGAKSDATTTYYTFANYTTPTTIFALDIDGGESTLFNKPKINFDGSKYVSEQVFYTSKDGTRVPMMITHHKDTQLNGKNPTLLYAYGGFNISLMPSFSPTVAAWLELGGVYAVANIRGGGEYGKEWHQAAVQMARQNAFDDFIAAGEFLIEKNYTNSGHLAIRGGSNGGLLVGVVTNQRPDLMQVALPAVGVMDMLRYHTFTSGAGWAYDFGTSEQSKEMFEYLKGYSPLHNISAQEYPAVMVTTADHDDRVVPAHSFKYAATIQEYQQGENPVLIRIETDAGHGAGTPISKTIEATADLYSFTLWNMGIKSLSPE